MGSSSIPPGAEQIDREETMISLKKYMESSPIVGRMLGQTATVDDDVAQFWALMEKGAQDLKSTPEMTAEDKAAEGERRKDVKPFEVKLEVAEELASCDALTGVLNRACIESMIEARIAAGVEFCVGIIDIDGFKAVNSRHGRVVGDELLKLFACELRSVCRSTDVVGRWEGDEFILLLDCNMSEATGRINRLSRWVCGDYTLRCKDRALVKLRVEASFGLTNHRRQEPLKALVARSIAAMCEQKEARATRIPAGCR